MIKMSKMYRMNREKIIYYYLMSNKKLQAINFFISYVLIDINNNCKKEFNNLYNYINIKFY